MLPQVGEEEDMHPWNKFAVCLAQVLSFCGDLCPSTKEVSPNQPFLVVK